MFWSWQQNFKIYFYFFERRWVLFWNYVWILSWFWVVPACITVTFISLSLDFCHLIPQWNLPILIKYLFRPLDKEEVITTRLSTWIIVTSIRSPVQFSGRNSQSASIPVPSVEIKSFFHFLPAATTSFNFLFHLIRSLALLTRFVTKLHPWTRLCRKCCAMLLSSLTLLCYSLLFSYWTT